MTPTQAAKIIGRSPQHVRYLIRSGMLRAKPETDDNGQPVYNIQLADAIACRDALPDREEINRRIGAGNKRAHARRKRKEKKAHASNP